MPPPSPLVRAGLIALAGLAALAAPACNRPSAEEPEDHHALNRPPVGPSVTVTLDARSEHVELASVSRDGGANAVPLVAVFKSVWPLEDVSLLHFDLVGADGFRQHDASIDGLDLPGCYRVRGVVTIDVSR